MKELLKYLIILVISAMTVVIFNASGLIKSISSSGMNVVVIILFSFLFFVMAMKNPKNIVFTRIFYGLVILANLIFPVLFFKTTLNPVGLILGFAINNSLLFAHTMKFKSKGKNLE